MKRSLLFLFIALIGLCAHAQTSPLRGVIGTYDNEPRLPGGRIDIPKLISELVELRANTYNFLIWHKTTDWDDLKLFLPVAREKSISVWVTLVPPSESPPHAATFSEPFRLDFDRWMEELAKLSLAETNLVAWSVDDFLYDQDFFTPERVETFLAIGKKINPRLAFVPCCYYRQITPEISAKYKGLFDGVLFPYFAGSDPQLNLTNAAQVEFEVEKIRSVIGTNLPVILDVYATGHANLGSTTPAYVQEVIRRGLGCADGVLIYCHQDPLADAAKFRVIKTEFHIWAKTKAETEIKALLTRPILEPGTTLSEVRNFCERRVPAMPEIKSRRAWEKTAAQIRRDVLDKIVFRGEAVRWRHAKTKVEWLETIDGGPGYKIRKLRYEALPGLWIPALLYVPDDLSGKVPVVMNVGGHEGARCFSAPYIQERCINLVKRGMIALAPDWAGMGQLYTEGFYHYRMNQLDLCGTSGVAPFFLTLQRGIDVLLSLKNADAKRVAVCGLSGGGWQTIFISALDPRVTLANPVAGYSSFRTRARFGEDLGDSEQTPSDLAAVTDYAHLTAMRAPRPTLLTFNAKDPCCFGADHALPPLLAAAHPIYALYGQTNRLASHVNYDPGDHNYGVDNREAFYRMIGTHFYGDDPAFNVREIPSVAEVKTAEQLFVPLPADNLDFHKIALSLSEKCSSRRKEAHSSRKASAAKGNLSLVTSAATDIIKERARLRKIVRTHDLELMAEKMNTEENSGVRVNFWKLKMDEWTVSAVEFVPSRFTKTAVIIADSGRTAASLEINRLLESGYRVLALDVFNFGETRPGQRDHLYALLIAAVGERPLGVAASQTLTAAHWFQAESGMTPTLISIGPRVSLIASVAGALEPNTFSALEPREALSSLSEVITRNWTVETHPEMFCFGLLKAFDLPDLKRLASSANLEQ